MKRLSLLISLGFSAGSRFLPRMGFFNRNNNEWAWRMSSAAGYSFY